MPLEVCLDEVVGKSSARELDLKRPCDVDCVQQAVIDANPKFFNEAEIRLWKMKKVNFKLRMSEDRYQVRPNALRHKEGNINLYTILEKKSFITLNCISPKKTIS